MQGNGMQGNATAPPPDASKRTLVSWLLGGGVAASLASSSASVAGNSTDLSALGTRIRAIRDEIGLIRGDLSTMDLGSGGWLPFAALAAAALLVWLGIPAVAAIWLGLRWRRMPDGTT